MLQKDSNAPASLEHEEAECSVHQLIDQMLSLKAKLNQLSNFQDDFKVDALLESHGLSYNNGDHELCRKELMHVQQEMERLKQRKHRSELTMNDDEINALRVQLLLLNAQLRRSAEEHDQLLTEARESSTKQRRSLDDELAAMERSQRARIAEMEQQFQKQRDRSLTLLNEKDEELAHFRHLLQVRNTVPSSCPDGSDQDSFPSASLGASASGGQILHYVEELARKKLEIQGLRRSRYQLETSLRELQMSTVSLEHKTAEQKSHLHEEIARLERNQSREGANLEYLKNVVLEFSVCPDPSSQSHMFNAIATILQFSPSEVQRVLANQTIW